MNHGYRITRVTTPAASLALVSLADAKEMLGIPSTDTSRDAELTASINAISQAINHWCDRIFAVQSYTDQIRGACGGVGQPLVTRQYPIINPVTVSEDGAQLNPAAIETFPEVGSLYRLDPASLTPSAWTSPLIVVAYSAGFNPIPADVQAACFEWLTLRWAAQGRDPALRSETIPDLITQVYAGDSGAGTGGGAMPAGAADILAPYQMWTV